MQSDKKRKLNVVATNVVDKKKQEKQPKKRKLVFDDDKKKEEKQSKKKLSYLEQITKVNEKNAKLNFKEIPDPKKTEENLKEHIKQQKIQYKEKAIQEIKSYLNDGTIDSPLIFSLKQHDSCLPKAIKFEREFMLEPVEELVEELEMEKNWKIKNIVNNFSGGVTFTMEFTKKN